MTSNFFLYGMALHFLNQQAEQNKIFEERAEEAKKAFLDARKLPRKQKKKVRKEAEYNYSFYKSIQT